MNWPQQFFVTGTDTDVGKTIFCSWFCLQKQYAYFKPIQSGFIENSSDSDVLFSLSESKIYKEAYKFKAPLSPHVASKKEGVQIELNTINLPTSQPLIVEGAGGVLVPLNSQDKVVDLILHLKLPVLIIAKNQLGAINQVLLTVEALQHRFIEIIGIVLNNITPPVEDHYLIHKEAIEHFTHLPVLFNFPFFKKLSKEVIAKLYE